MKQSYPGRIFLRGVRQKLAVLVDGMWVQRSSKDVSNHIIKYFRDEQTILQHCSDGCGAIHTVLNEGVHFAFASCGRVIGERASMKL